MPALVEKPKMSRAMWDALKTHIMRERQKKKQEQEQDAAIERLRKERENKQKQDVMTLEETKEQISQLEQKLEQLREDKHQLFLQLKKVLNEDETRRKARENDVISMSHYQPATIQMGGHPNMFMQAGPMTGRGPMFKICPSPQQNIIPVQGTLKRARSPSPPPPSGYNQPFNYEVQQMPTYPQRLRLCRSLAFVEHSQYPSSQPGHYYAHPSSQPHSTSATTYPAVSQPSYTSNYPGHAQYPSGSGPSAAQSPQAPPQNAPEPSSKHVPHGYHIQHVQQGYLGPMHQAIEHQQKPPFPEEKYYAVQQHPNVPIRGRPIIHHTPTLIPIQQQQKQGGITTGYPIRSQPPPPPPPSSNAYPVPTSAPQHNVYSSPQGGPRHGYANQPPPGRYY